MPTKLSPLLLIILQIVLAQKNDVDKYTKKEDVERMQNEMSRRGPGYGTEWILIPDGEGEPQVAFLKHEENAKFLGMWEDSSRGDTEEANDIGDQIHYYVYTRSNPKKGEEISLENPASLQSSSFDGRKPTKILIHGWKSSRDSTTITNIRDAYLSRSDVNVIGVDWSKISSTNYYLTPVSEVPNVGGHVAKMIDTVWSKKGARHENIHIIGHSLGAHVAGAAGAKSTKKVSRVTGLDPALPGFEFWQGPEGRLDDTDAEFVQVIHTCAGALGMSQPVGHADFYPNGGSPFQPGCCCIAEFTESCSHGRSHQYFAESILSDVPFEASPCLTWDDFKSNICGNERAVMGETTSSSTRGVYYLITNSTYPYALGNTGSKYFEYDY